MKTKFHRGFAVTFYFVWFLLRSRKLAGLCHHIAVILPIRA